MAINVYQPHVFVLPEDNANRQIANGFLLDHRLDTRRIQVLQPVAGWPGVKRQLDETHVPTLKKFPERHLILVVDFDETESRDTHMLQNVPPELLPRVHIIGCWSEPEKLKSTMGSYEVIGAKIAEDCVKRTTSAWSHHLLSHNERRLAKLSESVRPILFPSES
jgi:hypothetical protein